MISPRKLIITVDFIGYDGSDGWKEVREEGKKDEKVAAADSASVTKK